MADPIYDPRRIEYLVRLLRSLSERIRSLERDEDLLGAGPELMKLMGDARSELFHYEVRCTYETPQQAESRRLVEEALRRSTELESELEEGSDWSGP